MRAGLVGRPRVKSIRYQHYLGTFGQVCSVFNDIHCYVAFTQVLGFPTRFSKTAQVVPAALPNENGQWTGPLVSLVGRLWHYGAVPEAFGSYSPPTMRMRQARQGRLPIRTSRSCVLRRAPA